MPKFIRQQLTLDASPKEIYETWMDSRKHAAFTGGRAVVSRRVGGKFSCYDGYIAGFNVFLKPAQRIVQAWRGSDWDEGDFSIVDIHLHPAARARTLLTFVQSGVPDKHAAEIRQGWVDYYWTPLEALLRQAAKAPARTAKSRQKTVARR